MRAGYGNSEIINHKAIVARPEAAALTWWPPESRRAQWQCRPFAPTAAAAIAGSCSENMGREREWQHSFSKKRNEYIYIFYSSLHLISIKTELQFVLVCVK